MADRPFTPPLPADLPEDWTSGQIVAPAGADVGLSQQHGYNYLMEQVNAAQRALNAVNESFDTISGKRTCRVTVGTSTAGWTQADCDYLCDGTDDQAELEQAAVAVLAAGGGEITILAGEYNLSAYLQILGDGADVKALAFSGEPGATVLNLSAGINLGKSISELSSVRFFGITFRHDNPAIGNTASLSVNTLSAAIENCIFRDVEVQWLVKAPQQEKNKCQFVFQGNTMDLTFIAATPLSVLAYSYQNSAVISGNTFLVKWGQGSYAQYLAQMNISGSFDSSEADAEKTGVVFTDNTIVCDQASENLMVRVEPAGIISNNILVNAGLYARVRVICAGNYIEGGRIVVAGEGQLTGNVVSAPASLPAIDVMKGGYTYNPEADQTPNIIGNTILSGDVGIHLGVGEGPGTDISQTKALVSGNRITGCTTSIQIDSNWSGCLVTGNMIDSAVVDNGTGNLVRLNSDDTGSGGGGTAGVTSFKGRSGAVVPTTGDYTAAMVGARPDTWTPSAADVGAVPAGAVQSIQALTQAEYDALAQRPTAVLYLIPEEE